MATHADSQATMTVSDVLPAFEAVFPFDEFNRMQTETLPAVLSSDENVVLSAPTASGKTAVAEAAICATLADGGTALFVAPLRALTNEKEAEWERFEAIGYSVYVVTGERDLDPERARRADILVMTPEKADSATRQHDAPRYSFVTDVDCCVIDEVHLLDAEGRGSVLEVTVSRLRRLCSPRVVALSATMPNVDDVADWLDAPPETTFAFDAEYRPVPLHADVETYEHGDNAFADKYRRLYRALDLVEPHLREGGQALVFVASRADTVRAAETARDELADRDLCLGDRGDYDLHTAARDLSNDTLRETVLDGVGFHHAGLSRDDKDRVESWFRDGRLDLLFSTSTLAWGVNLPARCVVIRDTKLHDPLEGGVELSPLDLLQMLGRAGRPGYDDRGYAWVVADPADADRYRRLLRDGTPIESRLATDLATHLNAEIALGTVEDVAGVMDWLETTFYAVRARASDGPSDRDYDAGTALRDRVDDTIADLVDRGFVTREGRSLTSTRLGRLASRYYLQLDTAEGFAALADRDAIDDRAVLRSVARAAAFDSVTARSDEAAAIDAVLGDSGETLQPGERKVLAILRAGMDGSTPATLGSDAWVIRQNAQRLLAACRAVLVELGAHGAANRACRLAARVETGVSADAVGLTAIDGVGAARARTLAAAGITTPSGVLDAGRDGLVHWGVSESVAERLLEQARDLPAVSFDWTAVPATIGRDERRLVEVGIRSTAGGASASVEVTLNGHEMTTKAPYLGETTVPVALYGGETPELEIEVSVVFPGLPLAPIAGMRRVTVE